jgi:hypothetical protein
MEQDMHILQNSSLPMITLPGTHQSGAYWFSQEVSPDAPPFVYRLAREYNLTIHHLIHKWSKNQHFKIYDQLMAGIRYFDIRVCENKPMEYVMCHSLFGAPISEMLSDFKRFLNEYKSEIVVISFVVRPFVANPLHVENMIMASLGEHLLPRDAGIHTTVGEMIRLKKRMIITLLAKEYTPRSLWIRDGLIDDPWTNTDRAEVLYRDQLAYTMKRDDSPNMIYIPQWVTTVNEMSMINSILFQFGIPGHTNAIDGNERLLFHANALLNQFVRESSKKRSNVLFVDFYEHTNIVELARLMNDKCNDDFNWRLRNLCRITSTFCSVPQNVEKCPKSCGKCPIPKMYAGDTCKMDSECLSGKCGFGICVQNRVIGFTCGAHYNCASAYCNPTLLKCEGRLIGDSCTGDSDCKSQKCVQNKCSGNSIGKWFGSGPLCKGHRDTCTLNSMVAPLPSQALSVCGDDGSSCRIGYKVFCTNYYQPTYDRYVWVDGCVDNMEVCSRLVNGVYVLKTKCGYSTTTCPNGLFRVLCGISR